jgi:hypothetical protein
MPTAHAATHPTMSPPSLIRITVFANRNPALSKAEFNTHWTHKHAPLITSWLQRHNCVKYVQVRSSSPQLSLSLPHLITQQYQPTPKLKSRLTQTTLAYDGIADFWYKSLEDFERAYQDRYYTEVVKKDEEYLFDVESVSVTGGVERVVIEGGEIVEEERQGMDF